MVHNEVREEGRGLLAPVTTSPLIQVDEFDPRREELRRWLARTPTSVGARTRRRRARGPVVARAVGTKCVGGVPTHH